MWVPGQAHELALVHLGMDAGHADHRPAPHAPDPDLTISSPNSNSGRLYMVDSKASVKDSVDPGTTCKREALAGFDDAEIDSEEETLIFNP